MPSDPRLDLLLTRRSTPSRLLGEPGPTQLELRALVEAAARVPDHGRLRPWRLILVRHAAGIALGQALVAIRERRGEMLEEAVREKDLHRFDRAPLVLIVVASITPDHKIPEVEQRCSASALTQNLLLAAHALGFGAQWLTGWPAYDREVGELLGLGSNESFVAFVHIGTASAQINDTARPTFDELVQEWRGA